MALTVGEVFARRRLESQSDDFYQPGQHKAVAVEDKALLSWVDGVGRVIMLVAHQIEGEWVIHKPAHVLTIGKNGQMEMHAFAPSYRFDEHQVNALNEAVAKKKKPAKKEDE